MLNCRPLLWKSWSASIPASVELSLVRETLDGTDFVTINATFQFQYVASLIAGEPFTLTGSSRAPLLE